jgi:hypothetical protein
MGNGPGGAGGDLAHHGQRSELLSVTTGLHNHAAGLNARSRAGRYWRESLSDEMQSESGLHGPGTTPRSCIVSLIGRGVPRTRGRKHDHGPASRSDETSRRKGEFRA